MEIKIDKKPETMDTIITITVNDTYLAFCRPDPHTGLIRKMSFEDQLGLVTDAAHTFMGVMPPTEKE